MEFVCSPALKAGKSSVCRTKYHIISSERRARSCRNDTNDVRRYVAGGSVAIATCYHALEQDRCAD